MEQLDPQACACSGIHLGPSMEDPISWGQILGEELLEAWARVLQVLLVGEELLEAWARFLQVLLVGEELLVAWARVLHVLVEELLVAWAPTGAF